MANGYSNTTNTNQQLNIDNTNSGSNQSFPLSKEVLSNQAAKDKIADVVLRLILGKNYENYFFTDDN